MRLYSSYLITLYSLTYVRGSTVISNTSNEHALDRTNAASDYLNGQKGTKTALNVTSNEVAVPNDFSNFSISEYKFPLNWSQLCKSSHNTSHDNILQIKCLVRNGSYLDYVSFRQFTLGLKPGLLVDLSIICTGGYINFPWPFRAENLNRIHVDNCTLKQFSTENKKIEIDSISDTITSLVLENCKFIILLDDLDVTLSTVNSSLTRAAECGPENADEIVNTNNVFAFDNIKGIKNNSMSILNDYPRYFNLQKRTCLYRNLKILDLSKTNHLETNTVDKIAYIDDIQHLKVLNLSWCGLSESTLYKFSLWRSKFPEMTYLDLSHNFIRTVPIIFDLSSNGIKHTLGVIDLRFNNISLITKNIINSFREHILLQVDIRDNSFICDMRMMQAIDFLKTIEMPKQYKYLEFLKCATPFNLKGRMISSLSIEDFMSNNKNTTIDVLMVSVVIFFSVVVVILIIYFFKKNKCLINMRKIRKEHDAFMVVVTKEQLKKPDIDRRSAI